MLTLLSGNTLHLHELAKLMTYEKLYECVWGLLGHITRMHRA